METKGNGNGAGGSVTKQIPEEISRGFLDLIQRLELLGLAITGAGENFLTCIENPEEHLTEALSSLVNATYHCKVLSEDLFEKVLQRYHPPVNECPARLAA